MYVTDTILNNTGDLMEYGGKEYAGIFDVTITAYPTQQIFANSKELYYRSKEDKNFVSEMQKFCDEHKFAIALLSSPDVYDKLCPVYSFEKFEEIVDSAEYVLTQQYGINISEINDFDTKKLSAMIKCEQSLRSITDEVKDMIDKNYTLSLDQIVSRHSIEKMEFLQETTNIEIESIDAFVKNIQGLSKDEIFEAFHNVIGIADVMKDELKIVMELDDPKLDAKRIEINKTNIDTLFDKLNTAKKGIFENGEVTKDAIVNLTDSSKIAASISNELKEMMEVRKEQTVGENVQQIGAPDLTELICEMSGQARDEALLNKLLETVNDIRKTGQYTPKHLSDEEKEQFKKLKSEIGNEIKNINERLANGEKIDSKDLDDITKQLDNMADILGVKTNEINDVGVEK